MQEACRNWEEFEGRLLERYGYNDSLRLSKRKFMDSVESPGKERNMSTLLQEFEKRFARLSTLDRTVLDTSRVLLFVKSVNALDRESVGPLLETDEGLTTDWAVVKGVCSRFNKRHEWTGARPKASDRPTMYVVRCDRPHPKGLRRFYRGTQKQCGVPMEWAGTP